VLGTGGIEPAEAEANADSLQRYLSKEMTIDDVVIDALYNCLLECSDYVVY
jgi:hypothetical protein